jgi:23S rRNA (adenine2503-C2)-methyltransferase
MRSDLLGLAFAEFSAWTKGLAGHSGRFHRALYRQVMTTGRFAPHEIALWREAPPAAVDQLRAAAAQCQVPTISARREARDEQGSTTVKLLMRLSDGAEVESVLIPMRAGAHRTLCVSSQVGCRMGCSFCHTAKMGLVRSLAAHEIVGQVAAAAAHGLAPRNVVFMGMGEPLDNADAVARAVAALTASEGLGIAHRHITVSTVGRVDGIARLRELGLDRVNLAVSLGAADDTLRSELMPINRVAPLAELKRALMAMPLARGRRILVSYVVIPGVNDGDEQIARLVAWLDGLPALVNLIPYNPIPSRTWRAPSAAEVAAARDRLDRARIPVRLRTTRGDSVMAACGQLGDPSRRRRSPEPSTAPR